MRAALLIADEPVSSLDASIRGEILALLLKLREELGLGVLVVTHDLGLAWNIADRIAVMYLGRVVEAGPTEAVLTAPQHPYTQALLSVVPEMEGLEPIVLRGEIPDPTRIPPGCRFHPRCPALASGEADAVADLCRGTPLPILPVRPRQGTGAPATSVGVPGGAPCMTLQAALPRELYVDPASFARERERVLLREWTCVGRAADLGLDEPERVAVVEVLGESVVLTSDADGALHASYNVCRHRGSQLFPTEPGAEPQLCGAQVDPLPLPLVDLRPRRLAAARAAHRGRRRRAVGVPSAPGRRRDVGRLRLRAPDPGRGRSARRHGRPGRPDARQLRPRRRSSTGLTFTYDVAANWKVVAENYNECYHCGPVHPELSRLVPSFAGGGQGLDWDAGIPHREGAWTFTMSGTTDRSPLPGPRTTTRGCGTRASWSTPT